MENCHLDDHTIQATYTPGFKHQSPTRVFLRTSNTRMISLTDLILLSSNHSLNSSHFKNSLAQTIGFCSRLIWILFYYLSKPEVLPDGKISCTLRVYWGEFVGKGKNSRIAKATAAKLAMQALDNRASQGAGLVRD